MYVRTRSTSMAALGHDPVCDSALQSVGEVSRCSSEEGEGLLAHVLYFNNNHSCCARQKIEDYIIHLCASHLPVSTAEMQVEMLGHTSTHSNNLTGSVAYYSTFCVDKLGQPMQIASNSQDMELPLSSHVTYGQVYFEPFWIDAITEQEERRLRRMAIKCFNCGDDHHLKDCPLPKDTARICEERQTFRASMGTFGADSRYHLNNSSKRFSEFRPGQISDKLRYALNLSSTDYPPYIRRMMLHGYPPGYRLLAAETHLTLIDNTDSDTNLQPNNELEIIYPGFNDESHTATLDVKLNSTNVVGAANTSTLDDELGDIAEYEFEEHELEGGDHIVGLKVKEISLDTYNKERKCFSLDFPPGLVHLDRESQSTPRQRWAAIKSLLANKKNS